MNRSKIYVGLAAAALLVATASLAQAQTYPGDLYWNVSPPATGDWSWRAQLVTTQEGGGGTSPGLPGMTPTSTMAERQPSPLRDNVTDHTLASGMVHLYRRPATGMDGST